MSFRHARQGVVGVDGQLPQGWVGESTSSIVVESVSAGPLIQLDLRFAEGLTTDFVSLTIGPFLQPRPQGLYLSKVELRCLESQNVDAAFIIVREWIPNGSCVRQAVRQVRLQPTFEPCIVGMVAESADFLLQPVLTFKRASALAGKIQIAVRRPVLNNLYDYPAWISDARKEG
jgi:hypothetical protein